MTDYIKELLKQCKVVKISNLDDNQIFIPKFEDIVISVGDCYEIQLDNTILNVEVTDINNDMIKIQSPIIDGWFSKSSINIIKKI